MLERIPEGGPHADRQEGDQQAAPAPARELLDGGHPVSHLRPPGDRAGTETGRRGKGDFSGGLGEKDEEEDLIFLSQSSMVLRVCSLSASG